MRSLIEWRHLLLLPLLAVALITALQISGRTLSYQCSSPFSYFPFSGRAYSASIDHAVLAILMMSKLLVYREGDADFYIWLRRKARSFRLRKLLAALVALMNFFSSATSVDVF